MTKYTLHGKNVVHMTQGSNELHFFYDAQNKPAVVVYNGTPYSYVKNLQGDIVAILDSNKDTVVSYAYDAWGHPICKTGSMAETLGTVQPFRYRGYVYDEETDLYYLRSRYYSPQCHRFITADDDDFLGIESDINGLNLYLYCLNNPVERLDEDGTWSISNFLKVTAGVAIIAGLAVATALTGGVAGVIAGAALTGAVAGSAVGAVAGAAIGAANGGLEGAIDGLCTGFVAGAGIGAAAGAAVAGASYLSGAVNVIGTAQKTGTFFHRAASNLEAGKMLLQPWKYARITLNRALNTAGLHGRRLPDVIGIFRNGGGKLIEVVSKSQTVKMMTEKCLSMEAQNPGTVHDVINWPAAFTRWFEHLVK